MVWTPSFCSNNSINKNSDVRRSKKTKTCLASGLCGKKEGGGVFFFFFSFQNGRRTHFPKQPAGLFFQDGCQFFVLMGPTWTLDMTSVYLRLDLEKDHIFLCFFNSLKYLKNKIKKGGGLKKGSGRGR